MAGWSVGWGQHRGERVRKRRMDGTQVLTVCDRCRQSFRVDQVHREWTGMMTCDGTANDCWEEMHPSLNFQAPIDNSLFRPDPRDLPFDFENPPAPTGSIANSLRKSQGTGK